MTDRAKSLRLQGEEYILSEIDRVGVKNIDGGAIVKTLMGMGVSRATAWNWLKAARIQAPPPVPTTPMEAAAAVAVEMAKLPTAAEIIAIERTSVSAKKANPIAVLDQIQHLIEACNKVLNSAMLKGEVRNPRMMLLATDHLRRLLETAAKISESINNAAKVERFMQEVVAELRKADRELARVVVERLNIVFDRWDE